MTTTDTFVLTVCDRPKRDNGGALPEEAVFTSMDKAIAYARNLGHEWFGVHRMSDDTQVYVEYPEQNWV